MRIKTLLLTVLAFAGVNLIQVQETGTGIAIDRATAGTFAFNWDGPQCSSRVVFLSARVAGSVTCSRPHVGWAAEVGVRSASATAPTPVVFDGATAVFVGDSITDNTPFSGDDPPGTGHAWWLPLTSSILPATNHPVRLANSTGARIGKSTGTRLAVSMPGIHLDVKVMAYPNMTIQVVAGHITDGELVGYRPDIIFYFAGTNDTSQGVPLSTSTTYFDASMAAIRSWSATVPVVVLNILSPRNEATDGTNWVDTGYIPMRSMLASEPALDNVTAINTSDVWLAAENANNPTHATQGIYTQDNVHPNAAGKVLTSTAVYGALTLR